MTCPEYLADARATNEIQEVDERAGSQTNAVTTGPKYQANTAATNDMGERVESQNLMILTCPGQPSPVSTKEGQVTDKTQGHVRVTQADDQLGINDDQKVDETTRPQGHARIINPEYQADPVAADKWQTDEKTMGSQVRALRPVYDAPQTLRRSRKRGVRKLSPSLTFDENTISMKRKPCNVRSNCDDPGHVCRHENGGTASPQIVAREEEELQAELDQGPSPYSDLLEKVLITSWELTRKLVAPERYQIPEYSDGYGRIPPMTSYFGSLYPSGNDDILLNDGVNEAPQSLPHRFDLQRSGRKEKKKVKKIKSAKGEDFSLGKSLQSRQHDISISNQHEDTVNATEAIKYKIRSKHALSKSLSKSSAEKKPHFPTATSVSNPKMYKIPKIFYPRRNGLKLRKTLVTSEVPKVYHNLFQVGNLHSETKMVSFKGTHPLLPKAKVPIFSNGTLFLPSVFNPSTPEESRDLRCKPLVGMSPQPQCRCKGHLYKSSRKQTIKEGGSISVYCDDTAALSCHCFESGHVCFVAGFGGGKGMEYVTARKEMVVRFKRKLKAQNNPRMEEIWERNEPLFKARCIHKDDIIEKLYALETTKLEGADE